LCSAILANSFSNHALENALSPNRVVIHAKSRGRSIFGTPYANEYAVFLEFVDDPSGNGERKISRMNEFVDSAFSKAWFEKEFARMAEHKGKAT